MTIAEMVKKYNFAVVRVDGGSEDLRIWGDQPSDSDKEFIDANRALLIEERKRQGLEQAKAKKATAVEDGAHKEREYDKIWNDGGDGYNPYRDYGPGKFKVDTHD